VILVEQFVVKFDVTCVLFIIIGPIIILKSGSCHRDSEEEAHRPIGTLMFDVVHKGKF
jgi:hypothetical protein